MIHRGSRADQWAAFSRALVALVAVALITAAASIERLRIGAAAAGLLYLLPVLWVSARAGLKAGLATALAAAFCYNFFLLEPRYSLRVHGVGDVAAFVVLTVVAVVTSRLASDLRAREVEARRRAEASEEEAALATTLARVHDRADLDTAALAAFTTMFGDAHLFRGDDLIAKRTALAPLDAAAAAWALHNHQPSGAGTEVMPGADYRFVPLGRGGGDVLALAIGYPDDPWQGDRAQALSRIWVQARDRLAADTERQAREEAEARDAMRRTLLAALGHDFRTPLTVLKAGLAELGGEAAVRLGREVDRLVRLSTDLIASARLEGNVPVALEPVDLVDAVAAALPPETSTGDVAVHVDVPDDLPLVRADPVLLVHLLGNLLDNARRHARTVVTVSAGVAGDRIRVDVADDGKGVDPTVGDAMFDPFVTGTDGGGGSGLGLAIVRDLATAMGAEVTAAPAAAGGACFSILLHPHDARAAAA